MTLNADQILNKIAIMRTAPGALVGIGKVILYCDAPTVTVEQPNGEHIHWRADLCQFCTDIKSLAEHLTHEEAEQYLQVKSLDQNT